MICWNDLQAGYDLPVFKNFTGSLQPKQVIGIVGRNGAGKSSFLKSLMGINRIYQGEVTYQDTDITHLPIYSRRQYGMFYSASENMVFGGLTVEKNFSIDKTIDHKLLQELQDKFPILSQRLKSKAGNLSGGEKKILAFSRAIIADAKYVLLDEPTEGVAQENINIMVDFVQKRAKDTGMIIAEQNINFLFSCATDFILIENGVIKKQGSADKFTRDSVLNFLQI